MAASPAKSRVLSTRLRTTHLSVRPKTVGRKAMLNPRRRFGTGSVLVFRRRSQDALNMVSDTVANDCLRDD